MPFFANLFFYDCKFYELVVSVPIWPIIYFRDCRTPRSHRPRFEFFSYSLGLPYLHGPRLARDLFFSLWDLQCFSPRLHGTPFERATCYASLWHGSLFARNPSLFIGNFRAPLSQIHQFLRDPFDISCKFIKIELNAHY